MLTTILALAPLCAPAPPPQVTYVPPDRAAAAGVDGRFEAALERFEAAQEAFEDQRYERYQAYLKERKENPEAKYDPGPAPAPDFFAAFDALAAEGSFEALAWTLRHYHPALPRPEQRADFVRRAAALLPAPADAVRGASRSVRGQIGRRGVLDTATGMSLLRVMELGLADPEESAAAAFARARLLESEATSDADEAAARAELKRIFGAYEGTRAGDRAGRRLFELENLAIGMIAPDITGQDVDGNPMKLTDFRGKVVVLDFWGFW